MMILMLAMVMMMLLRQYGDDGELIAMKKSVLKIVSLLFVFNAIFFSTTVPFIAIHD